MASPQTALAAGRVSRALIALFFTAFSSTFAFAQTTYERSAVTTTFSTTTSTETVLMRDGTVAIQDAGGNQIYSPTTGAVTSGVGGFNASGAATLTQNGLVMTSGGVVSGVPSAAVRTTLTGVPMTTARVKHVSVSLPDGRVLFIGGLSASPTRTSSIEAAKYTNGSSWTISNFGNLATARSNFTATLDRYGRIVVIGGYTSGGSVLASIEFININTGVVTAGPSLNTARGDHRAVMLMDGRIAVIGGNNGSVLSSVELVTLTPTGATVSSAAPLSIPRYGHTATLLPDGRVFVTGGATTNGGVALNTTEYYTPTATTAGPGLSTGRSGHGAVLMGDGSVLVAGGAVSTTLDVFKPVGVRPGFVSTGSFVARAIDSANVQLPDGRVLIFSSNSSSADIFDPLTSSVQAASILARTSPAAVTLDATRVLIAGGSTLPNATNGMVVEIAGTTLTPTLTGAMAVPRNRPSLALLPNGKVLVLGGASVTQPATYQSVAEIFDLACNCFTQVGSAGGYGASITVTSGGRVIAVGGRDGDELTDGVLEFNPVDNTFTRIATLSYPRFGHSATMLDERRLLVTGGFGKENGVSGLTGSAELIDIVSGTSVALANGLLQPRVNHGAVLQPDGAILVLGGNNGSAYLSSVERFDPATASSLLLFPMIAPRQQPLVVTNATGAMVVVGGSGTAVTAETVGTVDEAITIQRLQSQTTALAFAAQNTADAVTRTSLALSRLEAGQADLEHTEAVASLAQPRTGAGAITLPDGRVVVFGGTVFSANLNSVEIYDPAADQWTTYPNALTSNRTNTVPVLLDDGKVVVYGSSGADLFNPVTKTSRAMTSAASVQSAAKLPNGTVAAVIGTTVQVLDPLIGRAYSAGTLLLSRIGRIALAAQPDGSVIVAGGHNTSTVVERWTHKGKPFYGMTTSGGTTLSVTGLPPNVVIGRNSQVLADAGVATVLTTVTASAAGTATVGISSNLIIGQPTPLLFVLDTSGTVSTTVNAGATNIPGIAGMTGGMKLAPGDTLTNGATILTVTGNVTADTNGTFANIPIATSPGTIGAGSTLTVVSSVAVGSLTTPRSSSINAVLADGRILLAGGGTFVTPTTTGQSASSVNSDTVEVFDPTTGQSTLLDGRLTAPSNTASATRLLDGRVAIVGADIDVFEPSTNTVAFASPVIVDRGQYGAALMNDGRLMLTGGNVGTTVAEIFYPGETRRGLRMQTDALEQTVAQLTASQSSLQAQVSSLQAQLGNAPAQIASLQAQLTSTQQQLTAASAQITTLQGQLGAANSSIITLQATNTDLQNQIGALQTQLNQQATVIAGLNAQVATAANDIALRDQTIAQRDATIASQASTIGSQNTTIASLNNDKALLTQQVGDLNTLVSTLTAENLALTSQLAAANQTVAAREATIAERDQTIVTINGEKTALAAQLATANTQISSLTAQVSATEALLATATQTISAREATIAERDQTIATLNADKTALTSALNTANADNIALGTQLATTQSQLASANTTITTLTAEVTSLTNDKSALQSQLSNTQQQLTSTQADLAVANQTIAQQHTTIDGLMTEKAALQVALDAANSSIASLNGMVASLVDTNTNLEAQLTTTTVALGTSQANLGAANSTIAQQQASIASLNSEKAALQTALDAANGAVTALGSQITTLTGEKAALQTSLTAANTTIASLAAQVTTLTNDKAALQTQLTTANQSIATLTAQVTTLTSDKAALQSQLTAANQNVATLTAQKTALQAQVTTLQQQVQQQNALAVQFLQDLQQVLAASGFVIPGATPQEQLTNLVNGIAGMPPGSRNQLLKELTGKKK